jgi:hypothetical protein
VRALLVTAGRGPAEVRAFVAWLGQALVAELEAVVLRAMARRPEDRFPDAMSMGVIASLG